jgi:hypothetical protein
MRKAITLGAFATLLSLLCIMFTYAEAQVGIKAGDWVKCEYVSSGNPPENAPKWVKIECLSVTGTKATLHVTTGFNSGTENTEIMTWDVASGTGNLTFQAIIQANAKAGDTVQIAEHGSITLAGEKTETYVGASRTVVYASILQNEMQFTYYWDKQTGIVLEITLTQDSTSITYKATGTNIWQSPSNPLTLPSLPIEMMSICISTVVAITIVTMAVIYTRHKKN